MLDESGSIHAALRNHLDSLGLSQPDVKKYGLDDVPVGVVEIELTVGPGVPRETLEKFLGFLDRRGIAVVPPAK